MNHPTLATYLQKTRVNNHIFLAGWETCSHVVIDLDLDGCMEVGPRQTRMYWEYLLQM